ncbi:TPA: hypothetical protein ACH3X1_011726 [Trebouxia sp. C0004]
MQVITCFFVLPTCGESTSLLKRLHIQWVQSSCYGLVRDLMGFRVDDLMDAKPSLLALTPVVRCVPVPMQVVTWMAQLVVTSPVWHLWKGGATGYFKDLWHADKKQDRNALAKPLLNILQEVEGNPVVKSKVLHLFRDSGVILLASGGAGLELLQIWGHWAKGSLGQAYIEKNPLAALQAFAIASGWEQSSFMRHHFLGRALATVSPEWIDAIFRGVRRLLEIVQARNARIQCGKGQADDLISDKAAEGLLQTVLYSGICFWQNLPFRTQRYGVAYVLHRLPAVVNIIVTPEYLHFTQQVMSSHDRANRQAEMDVSPAI